MMRKDCEVEVCSEEEGFEGAWFSAVLLDSPAKSGQKKLRVKYMTLLSDDSVTPLIESVKQKFVRPVPPETETLYNDVVLEEGSIVEADHKDGWWTGFVLKKEEDCFLVYFDSPPDIIKFERNQLRPHLEWAKWKWVRPKNKVLDKSMFCSGTMVEIRSVETKVVWFPTMIVKEIEKDGDEKKFIVKDWIKHLSCNGDEETLNTTVNFRCVRPTPPPSSPGVYTLLESVEAFHSSVWYQGLVTAVLSDKCYNVSLEATKEVHVFKHSELRPLKVWEDGVWRDGLKNKIVTETPLVIPPQVMSIAKEYVSTASPSPVITPTPLEQKKTENEGNKTPEKTQSSHDGLGIDSTQQKMQDDADIVDQQPHSTDTESLAMDPEDSGCHKVPKQKPVKATLNKPMQPCSTAMENSDPDDNGETVTLAASEETIKKTDDAVMNDQTPLVATPQVTSIAEGSQSIVTPSSVITEMMELEPMRNLNSLENDLTPHKLPEEEKSGDKSRKRKRDHDTELEESDVDVSCAVSTTENNGTSANILNNGDVIDETISSWIGNISNGNDALVDLPFAKKAPYWGVCESMECFKSVPQRPHFIPLLEEKDDNREWAAIGMMVTFYGLLEQVKNLKLDNSMIELNELSVSFAKLEKYGFDVVAPQSRIDKMRSLKDMQARKEEERICFENKIEEGEKEMCKLDEEKADLKLRILELQRQEAVAEETKEAVKKGIAEMKSSADIIHKEMEDVEIEFQKTASAPWN